MKTHRLNGELAVSRAIGDAECKGELKFDFWGADFEDDVVSCVPEVRVYERHEEDAFIIIACDGLWDVFTSQEAVDFLCERFAAEPVIGERLVRSVEETPSGKKQPSLAGGLPEIARKATQELVSEALQRGTQDNCTAMVIRLSLEHRKHTIL